MRLAREEKLVLPWPESAGGMERRLLGCESSLGFRRPNPEAEPGVAFRNSCYPYWLLANMQHFRKLPVLERLQSLHNPSDSLGRTALVCVQHLLETTGSLFEAFIQSGLPARHLHVLGKVYSSNPGVAFDMRASGIKVHPSCATFSWGAYDETLRNDTAAMWRSVMESLEASEVRRIVILDDGGHATATIPTGLLERFDVVAVEQTMSGLHRREATGAPVPVIAVASSAAKRLIEPPMICQAAFLRVTRSARDFEGLSMGVLGTGSIGGAIATGLLQFGFAPIVYDPRARPGRRAPGTSTCDTLEHLLRHCDVIWGCTGHDALAGTTLERGIGEKVLISCSSSDREFGTLLRALNDDSRFVDVNRLDDIGFEHASVNVQIRRGGFPVNFDNSSESVPALDIQVTRGLLYEGVMQACSHSASGSTTVMLSPDAQKRVANVWFSGLPSASARCGAPLVEGFQDTGWIAERSGGCPIAVLC